MLANQPLAIAGTLDIPASQKGARFVSFCDAFNLPIVTLVDTPGFYPGKDLEWRGMIRHGAQLVFAYGRATVARVCVILRKSYGGAYIVMDSKRMGNDVCLAWPGAELAVMGAGQASAILQRRAVGRAAGRLREGLRRADAQPVRSRRAGLRRRRHRARRDRDVRSPAPCASWPPSGRSSAPASTTTPPCETVCTVKRCAREEHAMTTVHVPGACPHDCPDTCAWTVTVTDGVATGVHGVKDHPITSGHLCVKMQRYEERTYHPDRLLRPLVRTGTQGCGPVP